MSDPNRPLELNQQIQNKIQYGEVQLSKKHTKIEAVNKFSEQIFRKVCHILFFLLILVSTLYSFPMLCLNYVSSMKNSEYNSPISKPNNPFLLGLLNFSNFSIIYHSETVIYVQDFILIGLLVFVLILLSMTEAGLESVIKTQKDTNSGIQSYSLQITVKEKVRKKQISQFTEYFQTYTAKCLKQKISEIFIQQERTEEMQLKLNLLTQIATKLTLIQDVVLLPYRLKPVPDELVDIREQASNVLIAIFSYQELAQIALQWWQNKQNSQTLKSHIINVSEAPSPKDLLFDKLKNKSTYKNKVLQNQEFIMYAILWQALYLVLISALIYINSLPSFLFSTDFKNTYSVQFCSKILLLQAAILFLHVRFFHENFILINLIKSMPSIITFESQANSITKVSFFLLMFNIVFIPFSAYFIVSLGKQRFKLDNIKYIIQDCFLCQYGVSNFLILYAVIRHIIVPGVTWLCCSIKRCYTKNSQTEEIKPQLEDLTQFFTIFLEFVILLSCSVLCSPLIAFATLFGILFKLQEFCSINKFRRTCIISLVTSLERIIRVVKYLFIVFAGIFSNNLLNGYILLVDKSETMHSLIISGVCTVFVMLIAVILQKFSLIIFEKCTKVVFTGIPIEIGMKLAKIPDTKQTQKRTNIEPMLNKTTQTMMQRIYGKQTFIFTYDEELSQHQFFLAPQIFQLNRQDSFKKINEQMNTMSRSLEETLKNRLLKQESHPFDISPITKQEEAEYSGIIYQDKVKMKHKKLRNVYIPKLFLPQKQTLRQKSSLKKQNQQKDSPKLLRYKTDDHKGQAKAKRTYELYNMANNRSNTWEEGIVGDSDFEYHLIENDDQPNKKETQMKQINKNNNKNKNKEKQLADQLMKRKVKFTDLFDSDEESIKNLVKRKIRQSIPKISY